VDVCLAPFFDESVDVCVAPFFDVINPFPAWSSSLVLPVHHPEHHNLNQLVVIHPADVALISRPSSRTP